MLIKKGKHNGWSVPRVFLQTAGVRVRVRFTESCRYDLGTDDQYDWNKLVGFSQGMHHENSARFCWRYSKASGLIELAAYRYADGTRLAKQIAEVEIGRWVTCELRNGQTSYGFDIPELGVSQCFLKGKGCRAWGYGLDLYFGGNMPAPHDVTVDFKRL
jgi:hypothetical protein